MKELNLDDLVDEIAKDKFFDGELKGAIRRTIEVLQEKYGIDLGSVI